ncbi:MAG: hypothetical protein R2705_22265 [Ilumatobacteraceae bacterium]
MLGAFPRPGELTLGWRWVLTIGWISIVVGMFAVFQTGETIHKPPFWADSWVAFALVFLLPALAATAALMNDRRAVWFGFAAVVSLLVSGLVDWGSSPGLAALMVALAVIGLLTTASSLAGRMPKST